MGQDIAIGILNGSVRAAARVNRLFGHHYTIVVRIRAPVDRETL